MASQLQFGSNIKELRELQDKLKKALNNLNSTIETLEELCEHKWVITGHTHNHNVAECTECGATDYYA